MKFYKKKHTLFVYFFIYIFHIIITFTLHFFTFVLSKELGKKKRLDFFVFCFLSHELFNHCKRHAQNIKSTQVNFLHSLIQKALKLVNFSCALDYICTFYQLIIIYLTVIS